jgi:hypothetical protein
MVVQYGPVFGTIRLLKIYDSGTAPTYGELTPGLNSGVINATTSEFNQVYNQLDSLHGTGTAYVTLTCDDETATTVIVRHILPSSGARQYPEPQSPAAQVSALLEQVEAVRDGLLALGASLQHHRRGAREEAPPREYFIPRKDEMSANGSS